jgi:hypothetical protein
VVCVREGDADFVPPDCVHQLNTAHVRRHNGHSSHNAAYSTGAPAAHWFGGFEHALQHAFKGQRLDNISNCRLRQLLDF